MGLVVLLAVALVACGDDEETSAGSGGTGATAGSGGTGGTGGSGAAAGTGGTSSGGGGTGASGGSDCVSLPTFADGKTPTTTIFVDGLAEPGGDGSQSAPFRNLTEAKSSIGPGTEVRVSGEVHAAADYLDLQGTADAPIFVTGEAGAILRGQIDPAIPGLAFDGASYVVVQDLEIATSGGHVLHVVFSDHMLFRRVVIHDAGLGCVKGSQSTDVFVEDADIYDGGQGSPSQSAGHPLFDFVGVNTGHIVRSEFHSGPGVMIMLKGGTSDMFVAWNDLWDQTSPGNALALGQSTGPQYFQPLDSAFEGLRIVAYANRLRGLVGAPFAFEGCSRCVAAHNVAYDLTSPQLVRFLPGAAGQESGETVSLSENCRFTGNILVGGQDGGASLNADAANHGPGNQLDHNVWLKPGPLNWWGDIPQDTTTSTYDQDPQLDTDGRPQNVALVDGQGAADLAGLPFADRFVQDFAGVCVTAPLDIGAYDVP
ncbi:MAG: right-handed parallel beta-helix repeat-containing protein [Deltaproteobacteria bacterium]|nr:right-handed parallel beta-helix repeat-containing protein [Deltaproteobacteria bacterium]